MLDLGVQQLPPRQSAKPSAVAWVPRHKAPDVCFSICVVVWQMPAGQTWVSNGGLKPPPYHLQQVFPQSLKLLRKSGFD